MRFLALGLFLIAGMASGQVNYCDSCPVTSLALAQQTATATPNEVINISGPSSLTAAVNFSPNTSLTLSATGNGYISIGTSATDAVSITNAMTKPLTIMNIPMTLTSTGVSRFVNWAAVGAGSNVYISGCKMKQTTSGANIPGILVNGTLTTTDQWVIDRNIIIGTADISAAIFTNNAHTTANVARVQKNFITGYAVGIDFLATSSNNIANLYNNTIVGTTTNAITMTCGFTCSNQELISNSGNDFGLASPATVGMIDHLLTTKSAQTGVYGAGCLFSKPTGTIFCDQQNFYISGNSPAINAGVSVNGDTSGLDLGGLAYKLVPAIGCYEGWPSRCPGYGAGR